MESALDKVLALRGVTYKWRTEEAQFADMEWNDRLQVGLIAQEVEAILPEVVDTDDDGYKSIQYSHIVPLLIEAIKDQQDMIDDLKGELYEVKAANLTRAASTR